MENIPIINLHPAKPKMFPGANAINDALNAKHRNEITETGIMVHRVIPEIDAGRN